MTKSPYSEEKSTNPQPSPKAMDADTVRLRPITEADTPYILRWRNAPHVMAQFIRRQPLTEAEHLTWLREQVAPGHAAQFIIIDKATDRPVGSVYIQHISLEHRNGEFGIFLGEPEATGKGLGLEATRMMTLYAFKTLGLHRVFLRVLPENAAAIRVYEKAGYVREGLFHDDVCIDGQFRDVVFMAAFSES